MARGTGASLMVEGGREGYSWREMRKDDKGTDEHDQDMRTRNNFCTQNRDD